MNDPKIKAVVLIMNNVKWYASYVVALPFIFIALLVLRSLIWISDMSENIADKLREKGRINE